VASIAISCVIATGATLSSIWILKQWCDKRREAQKKQQEADLDEVRKVNGSLFHGLQPQPPTWSIASVAQLQQPSAPPLATKA
jgi:hypothetical protein